jgi:hypothetical protein
LFNNHIIVAGSIKIESLIFSCVYILNGKPVRKRPLVRPRHRWEDTRMPLREVG